MKLLILILLVNFGLFASHAQATELTLKETSSEGLQTWSMSQVIDHGSAGSPRFNQRVFIDRQFAKNSKSPIILHICGEGPCDSTPDVLVKAAQNSQAFLIEIEHRYYGESLPFQTLETKNMKFLSTQAALDDVVSIIEVLRTEQKMEGLIVSVGCSYAGNLSAYLRATRPDLIQGAIAASAPIRAQAIWPGLNAHMAQVLGADCALAVKNGYIKLEQYIIGLSETEFNQLLSSLKIDYTLTKREFLEDSYGVILNIIQRGLSADLCSKLDGPESLTTSYYFALYTYGLQSKMIRRDTTADLDAHAGHMRPWFYQVCTEYGYIQIPDPYTQLGPSWTTPQYYQDACKKFFGIEQLPDTNSLNRKFYSRVLTSDKILFTNSRQDAWSRLSVTSDNAQSPGLTTMTTDKGYHCEALFKIEGSQPLIDTIVKWTHPQ